MLFISLLFVPLSWAQITGDLNCTSWTTNGIVYDWQAVSCQDLISEATCRVLFPSAHGSDFPESGGNSPRPLECYSADPSTPATRNDDVKEAAINLCPRTCGFCCETKAFKCMNKNDRINCATVTRAQCQYPFWRDILIEECPATCGYCEYTSSTTPKAPVTSTSLPCVDVSDMCDPKWCSEPRMDDLVNANCQKTCNRCSYTTSSMKPVIGK
uniref:ShKT domain-containing protein n=1 Tax=Caenorhabditis tropicalis TaxID=1561998 RepID=A0A1I7TXN8_9PELO